MPDAEAGDQNLTDLLDAAFLRSEFGTRSFRASQVARRLWPNLAPEERPEGDRRVATMLRKLRDEGIIYPVGGAFRVT